MALCGVRHLSHKCMDTTPWPQSATVELTKLMFSGGLAVDVHIPDLTVYEKRGIFVGR